MDFVEIAADDALLLLLHHERFTGAPEEADVLGVVDGGPELAVPSNIFFVELATVVRTDFSFFLQRKKGIEVNWAKQNILREVKKWQANEVVLPEKP